MDKKASLILNGIERNLFSSSAQKIAKEVLILNGIERRNIGELLPISRLLS